MIRDLRLLPSHLWEVRADGGLWRRVVPSPEPAELLDLPVIRLLLDHGAIVLQRAIPVLETDDAHRLAERILAEEHVAYSEAIGRVASGEYELRGRRFVRKAGISD